MKITYYMLAMLIGFCACKKEDKYLPPVFNYPIPQVDITENVNVGAYFYNYTAADWAKKYTDTPLQGQYISLNPATMAQERSWADQGGIDFFVFNWNGAATGDTLLKTFVNGRNNAVKMVINYNIAHLGATNASPLTGTKLTTMINELKSLATSHFTKDYYFNAGGQPVVMITPLNLSSSQLTSVDYPTVINALRQAMTTMGVNLYIIGEITSGWLPPQRYSTAIKAMNGVDLSNWATDIYDRSVFMTSFSDINWKNWQDSTNAWGLDFVPSILPSYNDKAVNAASKMYNIQKSTTFFTDYCNVAKRNMGKKRIVLINSWNDFQYGTTIEPAKSYGTSFLEVTKKQFKIK